MGKKTRARGGGRLGRSETVTIRLDPKLNFLAEIAARAQRRTKSSLIEAALVDALYICRIDPHGANVRTVAQLGEEVWHVDEWERLRRLAAHAPHLMTFEEQKIWAVITKNSYFWVGQWREAEADFEYFAFNPAPENLVLYNVEAHWDLIKKVASGEAKSEQLPDGQIWRVKSKTALRELTEDPF